MNNTDKRIKILEDRVLELERLVHKLYSHENHGITPEVGKVYKTRSGHKVLITQYDENKITYKYFGSIVGQKHIYDWDEHGLFNHGLFAHPFDLVGEWTDEHI